MSQGHASGIADHYSCPSSTGQLIVAWNYGTNNGTPENSSISVHHYDPLTDSTGCEGAQVEINCATQSSASSIVASANTTQDYSAYVPYSSSTYGYGSTEYPINYYGYVQQPSYTSYQQVGSGQNSGASYQPNSSFQNTGSYATSSSYSGTYHTGDYQTAAGYQCSGYVDQNNYWHDGSGGSYSLQHSNYPFEHTNSTSTSNTTASSVHYQQPPNHWSVNYGAAVSNVIPTPGSGNMVATTVPISTYPIQNLNGGYSYASSQPPPPGTTSWRGNLSSPLLPSSKAPDDMSKFLNTRAVEKTPTLHNYRLNQIPLDLQKPLKSNLPLGENHEGSGNDIYTNLPASSLQISQASLNPQQPLQTVSVMDARRVSKMQIPTNPRIASSLALGMPKLDKESSTTNAAAKPAYISVQVPKLHNQLSSSDNADANVKALPPSVCDYVRRCLSRCKDDASRTACQLMLSELITKAKDDGSLWTKNWDLEPPLPMANSSSDATNLNILQNTVPSITKFPNKRSKSRWEPVAEEKLDAKFAPVNHESSKNVSWAERMAGSRILEGTNNGWNSMKFPLVQQQSTLIKSSEKPVKKQRLFGPLSTTENDSNSAGVKEPELNTHHSSAITLGNSPEEKKKREHRSRRFDKAQESHADTEQFKPKGAGVANIYLRRASAMLLAKTFDDRCGRAVEDMDWDALTVKGTCQEIEKRYLRLTSAPDPATVRPEEILEKALSMVQTSQKNYYYKCDQLKSIRQDLTVQRIQNELTVKVYETHARLALEAGDLPEFNQCQSQLKRLYAEGIKGCCMEFSAYNLLCVILHSNNKRDLLSSMNSLSYEAKQDEAVKLALAVRSAVSLGNYVLFFRLYKSAPSLFTCLMDLHVEKMRFEAIKCMSKSYRPIVPVAYIAQVLGFSNSAQTDADDGKGTSGQEDCEEWLRAHGAVLTVDSCGELQMDTKASSSTLYMPEPEDAVAHGDANLAVDDFLTRAS